MCSTTLDCMDADLPTTPHRGAGAGAAGPCGGGPQRGRAARAGRGVGPLPPRPDRGRRPARPRRRPAPRPLHPGHGLGRLRPVRGRHRPLHRAPGRPSSATASCCATGCPETWRRVRSGQVEAWRARRIAQAVLGAPADVAAHLDADRRPDRPQGRLGDPGPAPGRGDAPPPPRGPRASPARGPRRPPRHPAPRSPSTTPASPR